LRSLSRVRRLHPDPGETSVDELLDGYCPWEEEGDGERPHVAVNFASTVDGRATIEGRSGKIGSDEDTAMLVGLRTRFDAILIGAGTMRAERYGRVVGDPQKRAHREQLGLSPSPLVAIVSGRLDLPWDAQLFAEDGEVVVFTANQEAEPPTVTPRLEVVRHSGGVDLAAALAHLAGERGVRALLCEGGPRLHSQLWAGGMVDELFLTLAPKLVGAGPSIVEGQLPDVAELELAWLLEHESELYSRYRSRR
jgi:riboflavin-specific deaminase-like protein